VLRLRDATRRACDLAMEALALLQTPRLDFGRGDDLRVAGIFAKVCPAPAPAPCPAAHRCRP